MPTDRHANIAALANEARAQAGLPARDYTAADVQAIMAAWQAEYQQRKAAGQLKRSPSGRNAWRKAQAQE